MWEEIQNKGADLSKTGWTYRPETYGMDNEYAYIEEEGHSVNLTSSFFGIEPWGWLDMHEKAIEGLNLQKEKPPVASLQDHCTAYLRNRKATYEDRRPRLAHAYQKMLCHMDLEDGDTIFDLGAGHCQLDRMLREECKWDGRYVPVDGSIDGTNLEHWHPGNHGHPDFFVLMETLEHLYHPLSLLDRLLRRVKKGIYLTVPNPSAVDVMGCDGDHKSVILEHHLTDRGFQVQYQSFFGKPMDTMTAWRKTK